jgi:TPR repeat protein
MILGRMWLNGEGGARDHARARLLLGRACAAGIAQACALAK